MVTGTPKHSTLPDPLQGRVGTEAVWATMELAILSPSAHIACWGGPRKVMPCLLSNSGSLGFSDACPHPAHTAWRGEFKGKYIHVSYELVTNPHTIVYLGILLNKDAVNFNSVELQSLHYMLVSQVGVTRCCILA